MDVYWLQQSEADLPTTDDWLTECEATRLNSFRFAKRRFDWRLGRWTAKRAVAACLKLPKDPLALRQIEIIPASSGQPEVILHDQTGTISISISHSGGVALCAVAIGDVTLGCDLEMIEPRSDAFIADYFTEQEQDLVAQTRGDVRSLLASLLWSTKESALKALHVGLRADTRTVEVDIRDLYGYWCVESDGNNLEGNLPSSLSTVSGIHWHSLQVQCAGGSNLCGRWQHSSNIVRTIVAAFPSGLTSTSGDIDVIELTSCEEWSARH